MHAPVCITLKSAYFSGGIIVKHAVFALFGWLFCMVSQRRNTCLRKGCEMRTSLRAMQSSGSVLRTLVAVCSLLFIAALVSWGTVQAIAAEQEKNATQENIASAKAETDTLNELASLTTNSSDGDTTLRSLSSKHLSDAATIEKEVYFIDDLVQWCKESGNSSSTYHLTLKANLTFTKEVLDNLAGKNPNDPGILTVTGKVVLDVQDYAVKVDQLTTKPFIVLQQNAAFTLDRHNHSYQPTEGGIIGINTTPNQQTLIKINTGATFTLSHRILDVNYKARDERTEGGVITNEGTFLMPDGGLIQNCVAKSNNGCIYSTGKIDIQNGIFKLCGGTGEALIQSYGTLTLGEHAIVASCTAENSPIIWAASRSFFNFCGTIEDCSVTKTAETKNNESIVYVDNGAFMTMTGGIIRNNSAPRKAGAILVGNADTTLESIFQMKGGTITNNVSTEGYGQICLQRNGNCRLEGGLIEGHLKNKRGACVTVDYAATLTISGATLQGHAPTETESSEGDQGGLIYCAGEVWMEKGILNGNKASARQGGLVYVAKTGHLIFRGGTLKGGRAIGDDLGNKGYGGAIYVAGGKLTLGESTGDFARIEDCLADNYGGAVYQEGGTAEYGELLRIQNCIAGDEYSPVQDDNAGGAVYLTGGASARLVKGCKITKCETIGVGGGLFATQGANVTVENDATISENTAKFGGGIAIADRAVLNLYASIEGNTAKQYGGGVVVSGSAASSNAPTLNFFGGAVSGNTSETGVANNLFLDYLASALPAAQQIKPQTTPVGNITVNQKGSSGSLVTTVWAEPSALGTDAKTSWGRVFISKAIDSYKNYTYEGKTPTGEADTTKLLFDHEGNIVIVKPSAQITTVDDLTGIEGKGGTWFLTSDVHVQSTNLSDSISISNNTVLETSGNTIYYNGIIGHALFTVDSGKLLIGGTRDKAAIEGEAPNLQNAGVWFLYGALVVEGNGTLELNNTMLRNCNSPQSSASANDPYGGAITNYGGKVDITNSCIDTCSGFGGAICSTGGGITITDSTISNSNCTSNGIASALSLPQKRLFQKQSTVKLVNTIISAPKAEGTQSAIWLGSFNKLTVKGGSIEGTKNALRGACVCVEPEATYTQSEGMLIGGTATLGGCIYNRGSVSISRGSLKEGTACCGGAIYQSNGSLTVGADTEFSRDKASSTLAFNEKARDIDRIGETYKKGCGGAIYLAYGKVVVDKSTRFDSCQAGCAGGGIFMIDGYRPPFIEKPTVDLGGSFGGCTAGVAGGGMALCEGPVTLHDVVQTGCYAPYGGGTCQMYNCNVKLVGQFGIYGNETGTDDQYANYFYDATREIYQKVINSNELTVEALFTQNADSVDTDISIPRLEANGLSGTILFSVMVDKITEWPYRVATISNQKEADCIGTDNIGYMTYPKDGAIYMSDFDKYPPDPDPEDDNGGTIGKTGDNVNFLQCAAIVAMIALGIGSLAVIFRRKGQR